jgi:hypothetical protein
MLGRNDSATRVPDGIEALRRAARLASLLVIAGTLGLTVPVATRASAEPDAVPSYALTPERLGASSSVLLGLIGAVVGGLALARSPARVDADTRRRRAILALVLAPLSLLGGGLTVATAKGGLGTGQGLGGGVVAMVVGLIGIVLGGLALARSRRLG